ncbi:MAG TPA: immunoglobulin domain-containing protein [Opitutaceae bacterium]|nr:immunoglobulin domain-containing protein [Opitutaceae bacterium]
MNQLFSVRRVVVGVLAAVAGVTLYWSASEKSTARQDVPTQRPAAPSLAQSSADAAVISATAPLSSSDRAGVRGEAMPLAGGALLWAKVADTQGTKLQADSAAYVAARVSGREIRGRFARMDVPSATVLANLQAGETVALPLLGGEEVTGRVNLVQAEAGNWIRVGGELTGAREGTFTLNSNGDQFDGMVLLPREKLAVLITQGATGRALMEEKPIGEVLCTPMPLPAGADQAAAGDTGGPIAAAAIPLLSSRPGATAVIYIDLDGETVTDSRWAGGATIVAAPPTVTAAEVTQIWAAVMEDFWPFNIDVTTDVNRYNNAPVNRRTRCIVTPTSTAAPGSGGVAYLNSFNRAGSSFSATIPCWVFVSGAKPISEAVAHEVGHTLGLRHDGRTGEEYYAGLGVGAVGWAPIMGVSYYRALTQWSKGEYPTASNTEDDLAIITAGTNGFGYVADEAGNSRGAAATLGVSGTTINQTGIVSQGSDADYYRVTLGAGSTLTLNASPAAVSPNLDLLVQVEDSVGNVLASGNPDTALDASLSVSVVAGTYYVSVRGTGRGSVSGDGYSNYASIGAYALSGTISGGAQPPTISGISNQSATAGIATPAIGFTVADVDTSVSALTLSGSSSNPTLIPNAAISFGGSGASRTVTLLPAAGQTGTATITVTVSDGALTASTNFLVTVSAPITAPVFTTTPISQAVLVGAGVTFSAAATGNPTPTYQWSKNGSPIGGATGTSFTISIVSLLDAGSYTVTASNSAGSVTSGPAGLTVNLSGGGGAGMLTGTPIGSTPWRGLSIGDKFKAFDGNITTAFDSDANFIYVGLDFGAAQTVTRIRYYPRIGVAYRMNGGRFRAANQADLSDAVTLYTVPSSPPEGAWQDVTLPTPAVGYRYVFFTTGGGEYGNVAELEFYGPSAPPTTPPPTITSQPLSQTVTAGGPVTFTVATDASPASFQWFKNGAAISGATGATFSIGATSLSDAGNYTVTVTGAGGSTPSAVAMLTVQPPPTTSGMLTGTPIGSAPWRGLAIGDKFKAFDGNTSTAFDSDAAFIYVGLDFGAAQTVTRIRYFPRIGVAYRMNGGRFRAANQADLSDAVTIYTVPSSPLEGTWQDVTLPVPAVGYRYVFFTTGGGEYGNVAELEFHGASAPTTPPPNITGQPLSQTINEGDPVTFVVATDAIAPTYQWFKNSVAIAGATGASYRINTVLVADAGPYSVVVTAGGSSTTSATATLTVQRLTGAGLLTGTPIGSAPWRGLAIGDKFKAFDGNTSTAFDSDAAFIYVGLDFGAAQTVTRLRYFPRMGLAYRMNGGRIRGANLADLSDAVTIYTITSSPAEGTWQDVTLATPAVGYRYVFFTTGGGEYGNVAELEFYGHLPAAPTAASGLIIQPQVQTLDEGAPAALSAAAATEGSTYQWHKDGLAIPGATAATHQIKVVLAEDAGVYTVVVTDPAGGVRIDVAVVVVRAIAFP